MSSTENSDQGPVIRDRRRIDPATGRVREPAQPGGPGPRSGPGGPGGQPRPGKHSVSTPGSAPTSPGTAPDRHDAGPEAAADGAGADQTAVMLAERTADLQRLQAEYANYRKRVDRDRLAVREQALANVLNELLPVLDDIYRAREHGELSGGFKSVADSLESITAKLGLASYGENGDPFDPTLHEALMHEYSAEVSEPTCVRILQPGYKVGDRIIRPARVAVAEPGGEATPEAEPGGDATPEAQPPDTADPGESGSVSSATPGSADDGADD